MTKSLLIVDDDQSIRDALVELFDTDDNEVTAAGTLAGALQVLARHPFDLIITDLQLGARSGGGLQVMAAASMLAPGAPIVVLTAFPDSSTLQASERLGATYFLEKPPDLAAIAGLAARHGIGNALQLEDRGVTAEPPLAR